MASNLNFTQNDYGMLINLIIKDSDNNAMSLDNCNVEINLIFPDKTKKRYDLLIVDCINGKTQLKITNEMTSQVGAYIGFVSITNPISKITLDGFLKYTVKSQDGGY